MALLTGSFLASYSSASAARARELFHRLARLGVPLSILLAVTLSAGGSVPIELAFGSRYRPGATALSILIWFVPLALVAAIYATALIANDRQGLLMRNNVAAALFNVGANVVVLTFAGIAGPAVVAVLSHALLAFLNYRSCIRLDLAPAGRELLIRRLDREQAHETVARPPRS